MFSARILALLVIFCAHLNGITNSQEPTTEFRALFIATVNNIDWPSAPSLTVAQQRAELTTYVDTMASLHMNAIMFQVRTTGDAFYQSSIEPWSKYLTGTQGLAPNPLYDPLETLIELAHAKGIQVHAWLNPYRANMAPNWEGLAFNHMAIVHREFAYPYGSYLWMDPGASVVVNHLLDVARDVVSRYQVDGVHMDDYFYPYPETAPFPDNATYQAYLDQGGSMLLADWRRENVNNMIVRMLDVVKSTRPGCMFSISPFGLYRPGNPEGMPPPITGFDPYSQIYADAKFWLQQGWVDFLAPQLYWTINSTGQSYPQILDWWLNNNPARRYIYASNGVYRIDPAGGNWPVDEIEQQISMSRDPARRDKLSYGNILFSAKYFRDNTKGINDDFRARVYTHNATIPSQRMRWKEMGGRKRINLDLL